MNLLQPTHLENDLISLSPLKEEHFEELFQVASDEKIWEQHPTQTRYKRDGFKDFFQESMESGGALIVRDKLTGRIIGSSRYFKNPGGDHLIEIGWTFLARAYWGGKYNGVMKQLMIDHAFSFAEVLILFIAKDNYRSAKAATKIGAQLCDPPEDFNIYNRNENNLPYIIKKEDWLNRNS